MGKKLCCLYHKNWRKGDRMKQSKYDSLNSQKIIIQHFIIEEFQIILRRFES
jgi:hypothetical protein